MIPFTDDDGLRDWRAPVRRDRSVPLWVFGLVGLVLGLIVGGLR